MTDNALEQMKLVYDYIKFHIGLYLATPPVFVIVADSFGVSKFLLFQAGLVLMILIYGVSGAHAGLFMGRHINTKWTADAISAFDAEAYTNRRRNLHHTCYWVGLVFGLLFLIAAVIGKHICGPAWLTGPGL
jgi:hypothetical protein